MEKMNLHDVQEYVNENIANYHFHQIKLLKKLTFNKLLKENPYLLASKNITNITTVAQLIEGLLEAFLSSSEDKLFGDFLEGLAVFIAGKTCGGHKSAATGVDLEFINNGTHYLVSVKSGPNWGNSSQQNRLQQDLQKAVASVKQSRSGADVEAVLGICYGKTKTSYLRGYLKLVGQNFWHFISENRDLYTDIIDPIRYRANQHSDTFSDGKSSVINRLTIEFISKFCDDTGAIDWESFVEWNSGNYDLDKFMS